jgi:hypothetical protein
LEQRRKGLIERARRQHAARLRAWQRQRQKAMREKVSQEAAAPIPTSSEGHWVTSQDGSIVHFASRESHLAEVEPMEDGETQ